MSRALVPVLLLAGVLSACDRPLTEPVTAPVHASGASFAFTNGPAALPHVLRSGGRVVSAFFDVQEDMLVIVGAPEDPTTDRLCGGTELRQFIPVQWVGEFGDIVKQLALLDAINILVYEPIPATPVAALCGTDPIAAGTGRYLRTDNDFFGVFGRANAVSEHVQGTVTLVDGSVARLLARFQALGRPDGSLARFETTIRLQPIGHPE